MVGMTRDQVGSRRRWRVSLIASLALNLLLIAVIGVWVARPLFRGPPPRTDFGRVVERMSHRLGDTDAAALRSAYEAHRSELRDLAGTVQQARERVRAVLRTDPYDSTALDSAMANLRSARSDMEAAIQAVMKESAATMSPDGRHTLARGPRVNERR